MWTLDGGLDADRTVGAVLDAGFGGRGSGFCPTEVSDGRSGETDVFEDIDLAKSAAGRARVGYVKDLVHHRQG